MKYSNRWQIKKTHNRTVLFRYQRQIVKHHLMLIWCCLLKAVNNYSIIIFYLLSLLLPFHDATQCCHAIPYIFFDDYARMPVHINILIIRLNKYLAITHTLSKYWRNTNRFFGAIYFPTIDLLSMRACMCVHLFFFVVAVVPRIVSHLFMFCIYTKTFSIWRSIWWNGLYTHTFAWPCRLYREFYATKAKGPQSNVVSREKHRRWLDVLKK